MSNLYSKFQKIKVFEQKFNANSRKVRILHTIKVLIYWRIINIEKELPLVKCTVKEYIYIFGTNKIVSCHL